MIGDGHNSILHQEDMAFDGYQLRSMSTLGFPENDMVNPWQNNKQCFAFITEKTYISLQAALGANLIMHCPSPFLVNRWSMTREIVKNNVVFPELYDQLS